MELPIIDILKKTCFVRRDIDLPQKAITTHTDLVQAAFHDDGIDQVIRLDLGNDSNYTFAKQQMPKFLPWPLNLHAISHTNVLDPLVNDSINSVGATLSNGQVIYHGSTDIPRTIFTAPLTTRPLSTTLSPKVAINELGHGGRAYNAGRYVIYILTVKDPNTNVFVYPDLGGPVDVPSEEEQGRSKIFEMDELEVLFAKGACVIIDTEQRIDDAIAYHHTEKSKIVPVYVCTGTIS